jgi:hypothetical protein
MTPPHNPGNGDGPKLEILLAGVKGERTAVPVCHAERLAADDEPTVAGAWCWIAWRYAHRVELGRESRRR